MSRIALISCTSLKEDYDCPAVELYSKSPTFRLAYAYAEIVADDIYVLSAKYGLVSKDQVLAPYNDTLLDKSEDEKKDWSKNVLAQLKDIASLEKDEFIILAGNNYCKYLLPSIINIYLPLEGKRQGERQSALQRLIAYERETNLCKAVHLLFNRMPRMDYQMIAKIPFEDGIYIMFEKGQKQGELDRIVRVGTHTAEGRLKARLKDHFISQNKDGSIFRKNIGKALLSKNNDPYLDLWTLDMSNKKNTATIDKVKEAEIETAVSDYLHNNISFVCFPINNNEARLRIEEALISLLNCSDDFYPDNNWLGKSSPVDRISRSGLWLTQGLDAEPLSVEEFGFIKDSIRFGQMPHTKHLTMNKKKATSVLPKMVKHSTTNLSVSEVRNYISNLLQQKKAAGESTYILRAGDLQKELGLVNATPTVCDAMTKKLNYEYDIIFAPPKGKSTKLTVKYYL
ncbi:DUF6884 domain-containing protein [Desulfosporosinus sp. BICA1-9]|uniref:DUF6884 domain-containing protein n=1 Tax=Desulfosporosinus sp. BICA1-9 TaxID=1531958 RepID=UPI000B03FCF7|nr:DUF6884 domain-containing protein [Desulfosporosinus sp. BICA1-9]